MGMDAYLLATNQEQLYAVMQSGQPVQRYSLSRTFSHFMSRQHVTSSDPELNQIGALTGVDIQPLYQMEAYRDQVVLEWELEQAESNEERRQIKQKIKAANAALAGNVDCVLATVEALLHKLAPIYNLPNRLDAGRRDTLYNSIYFAAFLREVAEGQDDSSYLDHDFGATGWNSP
jgi:hypothetical protein